MTATRNDRAGAWRSPEDTSDALSPILASALDAFFELGYHGTSVRDIAKRTGLTVPALYYHHENKEAILYTLLQGSIASVIERCKQAVAEASGEPVGLFQNLIECLVLYMAQQGKRAAMDAEIRALSPKNHRRYAARRSVVEEMVESAIRAGVEAGDFHVSSPHDTMRALLGMIWTITVWYKPGGKMSPSQLAASYVDIALHTVGQRTS
jgi:AcrR family transcriptional regulator